MEVFFTSLAKFFFVTIVTTGWREQRLIVRTTNVEHEISLKIDWVERKRESTGNFVNSVSRCQ